MNSSKKTTLVILAAGMGSRYGGLKQLDEVGPNGEAILDYSVYDAIQAGFTKVVFIIRHDFEEIFKQKVVSKYKDAIDVELVFQDINDLPDGYKVPEGREKPWGTAHAMLCAKNVVNEPFAVINADDFYGRNAYVTLHDYLVGEDIASNNINSKLNFAMVGFQLDNTLTENGSVARGICKQDVDGNLVKIEEMLKIYKTDDGAENRPDSGEIRKLTGKEPASMNMWAFSPEIFEIFESNFSAWLDKNINVEKSEYLIPTEVDKLIQNKKANIKVLTTNSKWFGVTYKEDKPVVVESIKNLIEKGIYPSKVF